MFDYYTALQFDVLELAMMIFNPRRNEGHLWEIRAIPSGIFGSGASSGLDDRTYLHAVLVRCGAADCERAVPIQSLYAPQILSLAGWAALVLAVRPQLRNPHRSSEPADRTAEGLQTAIKALAGSPRYPNSKPTRMTTISPSARRW